MVHFLSRRLLQAIPALLLISAAVFLVVYLIPGDPASLLLGRSATPEAIAAVEARLGLDRPVHVRYLLWLRHAAAGNFGSSVISRQPVLTLVADAFPVTAWLTVASFAVALVISVPIGILAALRRNSWVDLLCTSFAMAGVSIPSFWLAIMLIYLFSVRLRWFPLQGWVSPLDDPVVGIKTITLPAITIGVFLSGPLMRYLRSTVIQVMTQDYVRVARAKGLSERRVVVGHILRNSLIPFVTVLGIQAGHLLGGAIIIEQVFALPGLGRLAIQAIGNRDYPVVQGVVLLVAVGFVLVNIAVDLLYSILDLRIRVGRGST